MTAQPPFDALIAFEAVHRLGSVTAAAADPTPTFTAASGIDLLPQLPRSGKLNQLAWKLTTDTAFRGDWTALVDGAVNDGLCGSAR